MVAFTFAGIELVDLTTGETEDLERVISKVINNIFMLKV